MSWNLLRLLSICLIVFAVAAAVPSAAVGQEGPAGLSSAIAEDVGLPETAADAGEAAAPGTYSPWPSGEVAQACCRICRTGKACGDSCINRQLRCHQPPGCACNGYQ